MKYEEVTPGQEVWIIGNCRDKGKRGVVESKGWGAVRVVLDDVKLFDASSLSTADPAKPSVPLPPNFIPSEFKLRDLLEVTDNTLKTFNGIRGNVIKLPTSTSRRNSGDNRYHLSVTDPAGSHYKVGTTLCFEADNLKKVDEKPRRIEGIEIGHEDVQIGDTIRTELRTTDGTYSHAFIKEGKVARIATDDCYTQPWSFYSFATDRNHGLTFAQAHEKITLLKAAEDPYVAIVENLAAGTVIIHERDGGEVLTYVKSLPFVRQTQWHILSSMSNRSSTFVDDQTIINALNNGAEIVHKVRKPKK